MQKNRRIISYLEDIAEDAFGSCSKNDIEMVQMFFSYILDEIKVGTDTLGFRIPYVGEMYLSYSKLQFRGYHAKTEQDKLYFQNKKGEISMIEDELGSNLRNKNRQIVQNLEYRIKKRYDIKTSDISSPLFYAALEDMQNKDFEKHKKQNE
jgi:hypothetical protein